MLMQCIVSAQQGSNFSGVASYYGVPFHGRPTASGEIFSQDSMTAAHLTLAFGTLLKVTNRSNGKTVVVKINDRGPFIAGRIIDLSKAAADSLDFIAQGLVTVDCEIIGTATINKPVLASGNKKQKTQNTTSVQTGTTQTNVSQSTANQHYQPRETVKYTAPSPDSTTFFSVQTGSFTMKENAERCKEKAAAKCSDVRLMEVDIDGKHYFRVLCGHCTTLEEAAKIKKSLIQSFPQSFLVKFEPPSDSGEKQKE